MESQHTKRYSVVLSLIRGSAVLPQLLHGLTGLMRKHINGDFTPEATAGLQSWLDNEIEVVLSGGYQEELENFYTLLQEAKHIPSAKFNESESAMKGCCTVVTFVANAAIIEMGYFIRNMGLPKIESVTLPQLAEQFPNTTEVERKIAFYVACLSSLNL